MNNKGIRTIAWHEAGHATHALAISLPFKAVWVRMKDESIGAMGAVESTGKTIYGISDFDLIANSTAGLAGERILRGCKKAGRFTLLAIFSGCESDWKLAKDYIKQHNADPRSKFLLLDGIVDDMLEKAWNVLKREARTHKSIAEALVERRYITYEECKKLYEENA